MITPAPRIDRAEEEPQRGSIQREGDMVVIRVPYQEAHKLRVALEPCPCKGAKSISTKDIRRRLSKGLAHALSR